MSKNYQKSVNHCGRRINYPRFGALDSKQQDLIQARSNQAQAGQSLQALVPPPGVDVEESPCRDYYISRDIQKLDENCMNCIYEVWSNDMNCTCQLDPKNPCEYAKCVFEKFNTNQSCAEPFFALFNVDDVQDESFRPPFTLGDIKNCPTFSGAPTTPASTPSTPSPSSSVGDVASAAASRGLSSHFSNWKHVLIYLALIIGLPTLWILFSTYFRKKKQK
jgi:hypothetical protein